MNQSKPLLLKTPLSKQLKPHQQKAQKSKAQQLNNNNDTPLSLRAIIGLGNPGPKFYHHRHNIGFRIIDELAQRCHAQWKERDIMQTASITINDQPIILIKPLTFMNDSGKVIPFLTKQGITADQILVIHDELELPFSRIKLKHSGSARGHNGLRSIIDAIGSDFYRLRFGIERPEKKELVPHYVLQNFSEPQEDIEDGIMRACDMIENSIKKEH